MDRGVEKVLHRLDELVISCGSEKKQQQQQQRHEGRSTNAKFDPPPHFVTMADNG
jgi:hypothetical protein